jgi:hypothetical protein
MRAAKVVNFPTEIGSPYWTISATGSSVSQPIDGSLNENPAHGHLRFSP